MKIAHSKFHLMCTYLPLKLKKKFSQLIYSTQVSYKQIHTKIDVFKILLNYLKVAQFTFIVAAYENVPTFFLIPRNTKMRRGCESSPLLHCFVFPQFSQTFSPRVTGLNSLLICGLPVRTYTSIHTYTYSYIIYGTDILMRFRLISVSVPTRLDISGFGRAIVAPDTRRANVKKYRAWEFELVDKTALR